MIRAEATASAIRNTNRGRNYGVNCSHTDSNETARFFGKRHERDPKNPKVARVYHYQQ